MRPYSNLKTQHLGLVLILARLFAYLGFILFAVAFISAFLAQTQLSNSFFIAPAISILPLSIMVLFGSGVLAFLVAIEENQRVKNASVDLNEKEISQDY
jgi:hypothetical protein